jgi:hypothetical protein
MLKLGEVISQRLRIASGRLCEVSHPSSTRDPSTAKETP